LHKLRHVKDDASPQRRSEEILISDAKHERGPAGSVARSSERTTVRGHARGSVCGCSSGSALSDNRGSCRCLSGEGFPGNDRTRRRCRVEGLLCRRYPFSCMSHLVGARGQARDRSQQRCTQDCPAVLSEHVIVFRFADLIRAAPLCHKKHCTSAARSPDESGLLPACHRAHRAGMAAAQVGVYKRL
jgi:hypothetical protein